MSGNNTGNTQSLIRQELYQAELEEILHERLTGTPFVRDVPFPDGNILTMPSISTPTVRDLPEGAEITFDTLDSGQVSIRLNAPIVSGNKFTTVLREDSFWANEMIASVPAEQAQAIMERYETDVFALANRQFLGANNANVINGFAHRRVATGANQTMSPTDFSYANLSLTKAKIPEMGRVAFVDPTVAYWLENSTNIVNVSNNPRWEGLIETGMAKEFQFVRNIFGFDVFTTNFLADANETIGGRTTTSGKANIFLSMANDRLLPFVSSWKSRPQMRVQEKFEFDNELRVYTRARYGTGLVRDENLVVILSDSAVAL
jgi:hypothetical protein